MAQDLHTVLATIWQSGSIPPDLLRGVIIRLWKESRIIETVATTVASRYLVYQGQFSPTSCWNESATKGTKDRAV